ncbi:MAG TPA: MiaB/RimO family radical SAM methylthiotransferase [Spirochaetota bacterium]|nr:MiaB/RimO family radical SAM methylthiotransferase [Spirochaetota bacterium]HPV39535.1 MiaB/RimO family radical SAM methylthiotransferase [Spirochaetota bacterium]
MKIKISSLGCRLNQSEIQSVSTALQDMGHEIIRGDDADVFIVNSCAVTQRSEGKARRLAHHAENAARARAGAMVIVTGCIAEAPSRVGNTFYLPNDYKFMIPDLVGNRDLFDEMNPPADARFRFPAPLKSSTSRVNLKIQDGCDNHCSYCIVPLLRGPAQSKPSDLVVDEFRRVIEAGYREIILAGVMIGSYRDGATGLAGLVRRLLSIEGTFRVHLTSLMPVYVTPELIELFHHDRMVKHLHLSLQSGSNAVLARMNRPYTREDYLSLAGRIRSAVTDFNFTTDVIVGFPGETEGDFHDTMDLIGDVGFSHVHTFRFSPRPGTRAAAMEDTVTEAEKKERSGRVIELSSMLKRRYYRRFNGRESTFLSERSRGGITTGFNEYYAPVEVAEKLPRNRLFTVTTRLEEGKQTLSGTVIGTRDR